MDLKYRLSSVLIITFLLFVNCKSTNSNIQRGNPYTFVAGYPEIRFTATGVVTEEDETIIKTATELVKESLVFKSIDGIPTANALLEIRVIQTNTGSMTSYTEELTITNNDSLSANLDVYPISNTFYVGPGEYEVSATLTDRNSLKDISLSTTTFLPKWNFPSIAKCVGNCKVF